MGVGRAVILVSLGGELGKEMFPLEVHFSSMTWIGQSLGHWPTQVQIILTQSKNIKPS